MTKPVPSTGQIDAEERIPRAFIAGQAGQGSG
jgi:hypothetical protein